MKLIKNIWNWNVKDIIIRESMNEQNTPVEIALDPPEKLCKRNITDRNHALAVCWW